MTTISIVAETRLADLCAALPEVTADFLRLDDLPRSKPNDLTIIDVDLGKSSEVLAIKMWLANRPRSGTVVLCVDDPSSHLRLTQARALGATAVVPQPLDAARLREIVFGSEQNFESAPPTSTGDISADLHAISSIFVAARAGQSPNMDVVSRAGAQIVDHIQEIGLSGYLSAIRNHHSRTYTHCLSVTAVATSFGIHLGFGRRDRERLAVAGLLHDVGKSQIALDILEKPTALSEGERAIMNTHPVLGYEMLRGTPGLALDTLDMILHHHEYLDGSGYPHGLHGAQISDLNRLITIADVYGALIEPRSYRPPMQPTEAFEILRSMGPKLEGALVRAFSPIAYSLAA